MNGWEDDIDGDDVFDDIDDDEMIDLKPDFDRQTFLEWRSPRLASDNPTRMDNPVWTWLVRTRYTAYRADDRMGGAGTKDPAPCWSFSRNGRSSMRLPDGRALYIAGEHEDWYDPDFTIYNDVIVVDPDGSVSVFGYPQEDFPPTDFHSATLCAGEVVIIGSVGYEDRRGYGSTPVHVLSLETMAIRPVATQGGGPGWISRHTARLSDDRQAIVVTGGQVLYRADAPAAQNSADWRLELATWTWFRG